MKRKGKKGIALMITGCLLFFSAVALSLYNYYSEYKAGVNSSSVIEYLEPEQISTESENSIPDYVLNPDMSLPVKEIDSHEYVGKIEIFSLGIELPVIKEWSYPNFRIAPCVYEGTPYKNDFIVAAHNYRYHFGNIKQMAEGDKLTFTDMHGNSFDYEVSYIEILDRNSVSELKDGEWDMTLFTCTPGGRSRVVVRCTLIEK